MRLPRRGQAMVAQGFVMPNTSSFDPDFRSEMGTHDRARAVALLDMFGYVDKDGDGWRDLPDGSPLVLEYDTLGTADYRELDEIVKKNLDAVGIRINFRIGKWPEHLKASRACRPVPPTAAACWNWATASRSGSRTTRASRTPGSTSCTRSRA